MNLKLLSIWAIVVALGAMSAASSEPLPRGAAAGKGPVTAPTKGAMPQNGAAPSTSPADADAIPERVRMTIATFLERHKWFREYDNDGAPKLAKAKIGGPREVGGILVPKRTVYCVRADLIMTIRNPLVTLWASRSDLQAVIEFLPAENGAQRINGTVYKIGGNYVGFGPCDYFKYTPFPELEQVRAKRRQALGRADS